METQVLTPHVYWAQRHRELYLRVELSDVQVKAGLRDARGIGPPHGCPSAALRVRAPAVRQREPRVGAPRSPLGLQVRSGVLRVAPPGSPLFLAGAPGSRSRVREAGRWPSGCPRPSELWDEPGGSKVRRDSGLLDRGWLSTLASEVQPGRPIDVLKAGRWTGRGATPQPFSDGNLHPRSPRKCFPSSL